VAPDFIQEERQLKIGVCVQATHSRTRHIFLGSGIRILREIQKAGSRADLLL
jgi:hypothetical protein